MSNNYLPRQLTRGENAALNVIRSRSPDLTPHQIDWLVALVDDLLGHSPDAAIASRLQEDEERGDA